VKRFLLSLEGKFISLAAIIAVVIACVLGFYFYEYEYQEHFKETKERAEVLLQAIAVSFTNALLYEELGLMEEGGFLDNQIRDFVTHPTTDLIEMAVYDADGSLRAASDYSWFRDGIHENISVGITSKVGVTSQLVSTPKLKQLELTLPLHIHGKHFGTLVGYYSLEELDLIMETLKRRILLFAALGLIVSMGLAFLIAHLLARPIKRLSAEMVRVSDPYYFPRLQSRRRDEIGILEKGFTRMLMRLRHEALSRQETQQAMMQSERLATLGTLAANLAHEVSNPLAGARSCLRRIEAHPEEIDQTKKYVLLMDRALTRIESMVQELLQFSRKKDVSFQPLDLNRVIRQAVDFCTYSLEKLDIKINLDLMEPLDPVIGDANKLEQVFVNLLTNARDALPDGGTITIRTERKQGTVLAQVEDNGAGINSADLQKVFDPFFTTKITGQGTGLGLTICKSIVEDHRGKIAITSQPNRGTTVALTLPVIEGEREATPGLDGALLAGGKSTRMGREKALVKVGDRTLIEHMVHLLKPIIPKPMIITNTPAKFAFLQLPIYQDLYPDSGPLGGIHTALKKSTHSHVLILACDLPFVTTQVIRQLCDHALGHDIVAVDAGSGVEPLCAVYSKACLPEIEKQLSGGRFKVTAIYKQLDVKVLYREEIDVSLPQDTFLNINTPADLVKAEKILKKGKGHDANINRR
jgi:signal transduction histidine kinase/GTP:adenosylcobinamide-phosphate guanylyltransferase